MRVGFILNNVGWTGGVNYYKNLLFALAKYPSENIEIVVFVGHSTKETEIYEKYATVIKDSFFDFYSDENIFGISCNESFYDESCYLQEILKKHKINVLSHTSLVGLKGIKTIAWIPDFQHIHLPQFFTEKELNDRNDTFALQAQKSDGLILSSYDALNDLRTFLNGKECMPVFVLPFVSQPNERYFGLTKKDKKRLQDKYKLPDTFFYLPNQMWVHKNHITVFKAIKTLKNKGIPVCVVCTGNMQDYRDEKHIQNILDFVSENNLDENIKLLGLIDYADVFALIKFSEAVINPSLFEGWSSTVEECKGVGKPMILSDLSVHKEQYPNAVFFERENSGDLTGKLEKYLECSINSAPVFDIEQATKEFAKIYEKIVLEISNTKSPVVDFDTQKDLLYSSCNYYNCPLRHSNKEAFKVLREILQSKHLFVDKKILLFGSGKFGEIVKEKIESSGLKVGFYVDNDKSRQEQIVNGIKVLSPEESLLISESVYIISIIDTNAAAVIYKQLKEMTVSEDNIFRGGGQMVCYASVE